MAARCSTGLLATVRASGPANCAVSGVWISVIGLCQRSKNSMGRPLAPAPHRHPPPWTHGDCTLINASVCERSVLRRARAPGCGAGRGRRAHPDAGGRAPWHDGSGARDTGSVPAQVSPGRNTRGRMGGRALRVEDAGGPMASGAVEAASTTRVEVCMTRSGASWGRSGVLAVRSANDNGHRLVRMARFGRIGSGTWARRKMSMKVSHGRIARGCSPLDITGS